MTEDAALAAMGLARERTPKEHLADILGSVPEHEREALQSAIATAGGKREQALASALAAVAAGEEPARSLQALAACLLKSDGDIQTHNFPTAALKKILPEAEPRLRALALATQAAHEAQKAEAAARQTHALHRFAHAFLTRYTTAKSARALLDFDDLILKAQTLLQDSPSAAWVQYKMDNGIDHVLVDEAQDTSPAQWAVINALTDDFFAGLSARDVPRTIFVVGDEKQSIYSFQGADPAAFGDMRARYARVLDEAEKGLATTDLLYSFRSAEPILTLVDEVFRQSPIHGLGQNIRHATFQTAKPGRVDLWPFIDAPEKPEEGQRSTRPGLAV
ncbi:MAG: UvrD-helicase domain-containing protein, partial [Pseudomonadota bacterium]